MPEDCDKEEETKYIPTSFERKTAIVSAVGVVILIAFLLVRNEPFADANLVVLARIILSTGVATIGATVPGFLQIGWKTKGLFIRAGGALALFVLSFVLTPKVITNLDGNEIDPLVNPNRISQNNSYSLGSIIRSVSASEIESLDSDFYVRAVYEGDEEEQRKFFDVLFSNRGDEQRLLYSFHVKWLYYRGMAESVESGKSITPVERYAIPLYVDPDRGSVVFEKEIDVFPPLILPPRNSSGPSVTSVRLEVYYTFEGARINYHPNVGWDIYYEITAKDEFGDTDLVMSMSWKRGVSEDWIDQSE